VVQVVEHLPSKCEALSSNSRATKSEIRSITQMCGEKCVIISLSQNAFKNSVELLEVKEKSIKHKKHLHVLRINKEPLNKT
jgi:hypothetical protein